MWRRLRNGPRPTSSSCAKSFIERSSTMIVCGRSVAVKVSSSPPGTHAVVPTLQVWSNKNIYRVYTVITYDISLYAMRPWHPPGVSPAERVVQLAEEALLEIELVVRSGANAGAAEASVDAPFGAEGRGTERYKATQNELAWQLHVRLGCLGDVHVHRHRLGPQITTVNSMK